MNDTSTYKYIANALYIPFVAFLNFLEVDKLVIALYALLLVIDIITGILKAIKLGHKPSSKNFLIGIMAKLTFLLIPLVIAVAAKAIGIDLKLFVITVINALILNEVYSTIANIYTINTGKKAEEFDVLSLILKFIREFVQRMLNDNK